MAARSSEVAPAQEPGSDLVTQDGRTSIADVVVAKIAGIAAREVAGVHQLGGGASRALGGLRERLPGVGSQSPSTGVRVEVGQVQAAVDINLVVEYGVPIVGLADEVRASVIERVEDLTGLEVTEVNISVDDVYLDDGGDTDDESPPAR